MPIVEESVTENVITSEMNMPDPVKFEPGEDSPGPVTFDHESHVDPDEPNCKTCHLKMFKIRPVRAGALGAVSMEKLYDGKQCGTCHNGEDSFSVEDCEFCHGSE